MSSTSTSTGPSRSVPRHALRRGTRGFAAVVLCLIAMLTLAVAVFVLPSAPLDRQVLSWLIPLTFAFGIAHLAAIYGIARRGAWVVSLTINLAMIGIGVAAFGILLSLTGADPFAPTSALPADRARSDGIGLLIWMIGAWTVAARFVVRGMAAPVDRSADLGPAVVMPVPAPEPAAHRRSLLGAGWASAVQDGPARHSFGRDPAPDGSARTWTRRLDPGRFRQIPTARSYVWLVPGGGKRIVLQG